MLDALLTFVLVVCLASLGVFLALCFGAVVEAFRDRRWRREYERELRDAEESLARDLERWRWVTLESVAPPSRKRSRSETSRKGRSA